MNIKRRLFLSNILMIVIPLVMSLAIFFGGLHFYAVATGLQDRRRNEAAMIRFMEALEQAQELAEEWEAEQDFAVMASGVKNFNEKYMDGRVALTLYKDGVPLTEPPRDEEPLVEQALKMDAPVTVYARNGVRVLPAGGYRLVLSSQSRFTGPPQNYSEIMKNGLMFSLVCSVVIILFTNRFLTQFVFKKIVLAMDTLTHGVHQVRDGNLEFRIDYRKKDEFSGVCDDFNEMAARLLESVKARQKDEQSRKELIAGMSHDLRTPLTSIKAYVEGIEKGVAATHEARLRYIGTIKDKTKDLEHIIDTLFLFAKLDTGEFPYRIERVDLAAKTAEIANSLAEEYAERGLDISRVSGGEGFFYTDVDVAQMRYVMINIFENSVKYKVKPRGAIRVRVFEDGDSVVLAMADDGPGVQEEALPKLFDVFYRGDGSRSNPGKGSGLGLAIAAKMVRHLGGVIEAVNVPTGGLSINMTFPKRLKD